MSSVCLAGRGRACSGAPESSFLVLLRTIGITEDALSCVRRPWVPCGVGPSSCGYTMICSPTSPVGGAGRWALPSGCCPRPFRARRPAVGAACACPRAGSLGRQVSRRAGGFPARLCRSPSHQQHPCVCRGRGLSVSRPRRCHLLCLVSEDGPPVRVWPPETRSCEAPAAPSAQGF